MENLTDEQLVILLSTSDAKAFSEIFRRYRELLLLFTFRRVQDVEVSKDLIHDAFIEIWETRGNLNIEGSLREFLLKLLRSRILYYFSHGNLSKNYLDKFDTYLQQQKEFSPTTATSRTKLVISIIKSKLNIK